MCSWNNTAQAVDLCIPAQNGLKKCKVGLSWKQAKLYNKKHNLGWQANQGPTELFNMVYMHQEAQNLNIPPTCEISFDRLKYVAPTIKCSPKQEQKESEMDMLVQEEKSQRNFLERRLYDIRVNKIDEAQEKFYINGDGVPRSWADLTKRIADGQFVYNKEAAEANDNVEDWGFFGYVEWRDPNRPADKEGYKAFIAKLDKAQEDARDVIRVSYPTDGLKALEDFKAFPVQ